MSTNKLVVTGILAVIIVAIYTVFSIAPDHSHDHGLKHNILAHSLDSLPYEANDEADRMKTVSHISADSAHQFLVGARKDHIGAFPCTNCHTKSMDNMKNDHLPGMKKAHWNIDLVHAGPGTMNCRTCHNSGSPDELTSLTAESISFDKAFELCGQCHSTQFKDWEGGAHGKRLTGWKSDRVAKSCVGCHNPHSPAIESRWPSRFNTKSLEAASAKNAH